ELQVLRIAAEHGPDADLHPVTQDDAALERGARGYPPAATEPAVLPDDRERPDLDVRADLGARVDQRRRMNASPHLSRAMAPISPSPTTSPSTFATPCILHIMPRTWSSSSSNRSWSPGFTGRRHLTLFSDVK